MKTYLKVEFEVQSLKDAEQITEDICKSFEAEFREIDVEKVERSENVQVNVEGHLTAGVEIVVAVIGLATAIIELYKFLKEKEIREKELEVEKEKILLEFGKLSNLERQRLTQAFIEEDLPQILHSASLNYINLGTSIYIEQ